MTENQIKWSYIIGTNKSYILLNNGKIFSKFRCDYITPYTNKNGTLFYKLRYQDGTRIVSINTLLKQHFNINEVK